MASSIHRTRWFAWRTATMPNVVGAASLTAAQTTLNAAGFSGYKAGESAGAGALGSIVSQVPAAATTNVPLGTQVALTIDNT